MTDHIVTAFDQDLKEISRKVAEMGGLAERNMADAVDALVKRDTILGQRVIDTDAVIDRLQREVEEKAVLTIARRQPVASDLREVVAALRVSNDIERIGDLAKNIGKRVIALNGEYQPQKLMRGVEHMSGMVEEQLKEVLDAFAQRDKLAALAVWKRDGEVDQLYTSLFRELLTYMMEDPRNISMCTHLLFCAKNIERIGDHATNIAETIYYLVEGEMLTEERPKGDQSSFTPVNFGG